MSVPIAMLIAPIANTSPDTTSLLQGLTSKGTLLPSAIAAMVLSAMFRRVPNASSVVRHIWSHVRVLLAAGTHIRRISAAADAALSARERVPRPRRVSKKHHSSFLALSPIGRSVPLATRAGGSAMPFDMELDEDLSERRLRRLELRYRSAQTALAESRALYASLSEIPGTTDLQRHQAELRMQRAARHLLDIQKAIDVLEDTPWDGRPRQ